MESLRSIILTKIDRILYFDIRIRFFKISFSIRLDAFDRSWGRHMKPLKNKRKVTSTTKLSMSFSHAPNNQ
ncbi:hypothetical protein D1AOALGA4SA_6414 [Olavius algarvensis Delta 1 endosymbiont]|nr:hypothetical protein D1AOALGA4SA_6414 [Olavius algarvensis Delta 1 endosymbiont]